MGYLLKTLPGLRKKLHDQWARGGPGSVPYSQGRGWPRGLGCVRLGDCIGFLGCQQAGAHPATHCVCQQVPVQALE